MEDLYDLEKKILAATSGKWSKIVEAFKKNLILHWMQMTSDNIDDLSQLFTLVTDLGEQVPEMDEAAQAGLIATVAYAISRYTQNTGEEVPEDGALVVLPAAIIAVAVLEAKARQSISDAIKALMSTPLDDKLETVITTLSPIFTVARNLNSAVTWAVNNTANTVTSKLSTDRGHELIWVPERNACLHCIAYSGQVSEGGQFKGGLTFGKKALITENFVAPPLHPNCLPAGMRVSAGSALTGASSRVFEGELVTITTLRGHVLTGTPNHPVLTNRGWVGLGFLNETDSVFSRTDGKLAVSDNSKHVPAPIEEVAVSLLGSSKVATAEVPVSAEHFHGDGEGSDVAVVGSNSLLWHERNALALQHVDQNEFVWPDVNVVDSETLTSLSTEAASLPGVSHSTSSGLSWRGELLPVVSGELAHSDRVRFGQTADGDVTRDKTVVDSVAGDTEASSDALCTLAGQVSLDNIVNISRELFSGHVYNLETEKGWYLAEAIVTHNCRCELRPYLDGMADFADALEREAVRSVLKGFALPSESEKSRIEAAARLLAQSPNAPKSVIAAAKKAVAAGEF